MQRRTAGREADVHVGNGPVTSGRLRRMVRWVTGTAVVVLVVWGVVALRQQRSLFDQPGETAVAEFGRIEIPITATGEAKEARRVEVKSEASGRIEQITVEEGDLVEKGQVLVVLNPKDEQRNVNQRKAAVEQARANYERLKLAFERAKQELPLNIAIAEHKVAQAKAAFDRANAEYRNKERLYEQGHAAELEFVVARSLMLAAQADWESAKGELEKLRRTGPIAVEEARAMMEVAKAELDSAEEALREAEQRLEKTVIKSPIAGRVVKIPVSEGWVISSGTASFTGGTVLMEIVDTSELIVEAQVDEEDIDRVHEMLRRGRELRDRAESNGAALPEPMPDVVSVRFDALRDVTFTGRIIEIAQEPDTLANITTYDTRILLKECPDLERVRLGMQCTVEFAAQTAEGLCVPRPAVHRRGPDDYIVYVPVMRNGRDEPEERPVKVGLSDGARVIITEGLKEGEVVYTRLPRRFVAEEE